jgi:hypothetical protein
VKAVRWGRSSSRSTERSRRSSGVPACPPGRLRGHEHPRHGRLVATEALGDLLDRKPSRDLEGEREVLFLSAPLLVTSRVLGGRDRLWLTGGTRGDARTPVSEAARGTWPGSPARCSSRTSRHARGGARYHRSRSWPRFGCSFASNGSSRQRLNSARCSGGCHYEAESSRIFRLQQEIRLDLYTYRLI